jgi:hypothetical protein
MKKIITSFSMTLIASISVLAQTPITLTQANFAKLSTYHVLNGDSIATIQFQGSNINFDYGATPLPSAGTIDYYTAIDPFFSSQCDVFEEATHMVSGLMYNVNNYYVTNAAMLSQNAIHIPAQGYSETAVTGGANDSIIFPEQKLVLPVGREILKFPCTTGYTNTSVSRRPINFNLSVAAFGLNQTPCQNVFTITRHDTVTGYGKMRLQIVGGGASQYYPVLILKSWQTTTDSFYLAGLPAPTAITNAFGVTQGMVSSVSNRVYYYREHRAVPFALVNCGSSPFDNFLSLTFDADSLSYPLSTTSVEKNNFATVLYPNPSNGNPIHIDFVGKKVSEVNYLITDIMGKKIQAKNKILLTDNKLDFMIDATIPNGFYNITITNSLTQSIATEQFQLQR